MSDPHLLDISKKAPGLKPAVTVRIFRTGQTQILWEIEDTESILESTVELLAIIAAAHLATDSIQQTLYAILAPAQSKGSIDRDFRASLSKESQN